MANGIHEMLPPSKHYTNLEQRLPEDVELFKIGETPPKPCVRIASVAAHGNGHATMQILENKIKEESGKLGADLVILTQLQTTNSGTVGSYGGGIMTTTIVNTPHLYGVACMYSKVLLGIFFEEDGVIKYVNGGSLAERYGLKEGHKIVAINGKFVNWDGFTLEEELNVKSPGDKVKIEYLDKDLNKNMVEITL